MFATYDSSGVMRLLSPYDDFGCSWRPVFDGRIAREGKQLWYWPIGVTETQLMCVICKSGDKQPFPPKSIISDIDLKVPVLNGEGLSSVEEESLLRQRLMATHQLARAHATGEPISKEREMKVKLFGDIDRSVIKQILAACKQEKTQKVLELTHQLTSVKAIDGAMKCAVSYKLSGVANKINQIKEAFIKKEEEAAMKMRQVRAIAHPAVPPVAIKTEAVVVAPAAEPAKKHVLVDTPRPAASIPNEPEAEPVQAESSMDTFSNAFEDDPLPEVPASAGKRKGIFGAVKLEPGLKAPPVFGGGAAKKAKNAANSAVDEVAPVARVKNPFAANTASTASASVKTASKTGTVGGLFQDLKESNDSKTVATTKSTKEEQLATKVKKQESLLGFFKKGPIKAPSASTETSPVKTEAPAQPDEDEMQLDAALDMLKAATGDEVKENESQIPIRTWEEKGKARAEGGELERQSSF
ncbi:hypothetical protein HDU99_006891 [Rhizoclosmatium hyalinum]|nr:hypothetical protein HDU99_006891 [Rhizoclosmatium hyalinum]